AFAAAARGALGSGSNATAGLHSRRLAEPANPSRTVGVVSHHHIGCHTGFDDLEVQRVHNRGGHSRADRHGQEGGADSFPGGQAKAHIGGAAGGVDLQFALQPAQEMHDLHPGLVDGSDGHDEGIDHHVSGGNPVVGGPSFDMATTAAPYFFTSGSTLSRRSSSPVTELTRALPL